MKSNLTKTQDCIKIDSNGEVEFSEKYKQAVKDEFKDLSCKVFMVIFKGGIRNGELELKTK